MSGHFVGDLIRDSSIAVKQEPTVTDSNSMMHTTASVPIPARRIMDLGFTDYTLDIDNSQSPLYQDTSYTGTLLPVDPSDGMLWTNRSMHADDLLKTEAFIHMDEDDIFQVDKADLIQGPTLAELNANDETLLGDLNFDDLQLPEELYLNMPQKISTPAMQINNPNHMNNNNSLLAASSCPQSSMLYYRDLDFSSSMPVTNMDVYNTKTYQPPFSPSSQTNSSSPLLQSSPLHVSPFQQKHSTLQELLVKREIYESPDRNVLGQSMPGHTTPSGSPNVRPPRGHMSRLSTSAPTHLGLEQIWQRREPRKHLLSTGSIVEAGSTSSLSTGGVLSPDPQDFSHDEDSDEDSDAHYEDYSSGNEDSDDNDDPRSRSSASKRERYFWQYNVQAKGPKGERLVMKTKLEDPHVLHEVTDPVFSTDCSVKGIKHSGKARKGDGNDLTPNARKLFNIGKELDKLSHVINDMTPVSELPLNVRPKTRKEKNKLASRACRLKKKAQHEANKIKLSGLEIEHKRLINGIGQAKSILLAMLNELTSEKREELNAHMEKVVKSSSKMKVAGHTTEYVNKILDKISSGHTVGLDDL